MSLFEVIHWKTNDAPGVRCFSDLAYAQQRVRAMGGELQNLHEAAADCFVYWPPERGAFPSAATLAQWQAEYDAQFTLDGRAANAVDAMDRLQFTHLFELENRMRVLEGQLTVSVAAYRNALINKWKQLNG